MGLFWLNFQHFKPNSDEIKNINNGINKINLDESKKKDEDLIKEYKVKNNLGPEETIKAFTSAYNKSNFEAIKYVSPIPDFLRFDYFDSSVLNSYKGTDKEELSINYNKARIYKNYYIYNLVKDIKLNEGSLKLIEDRDNHKIYSLELAYNNLTKNVKDISELLYLESDTASFLKFLKENSVKDKKTINVYVKNYPELGYRIDLSNKENYNLISVLSGGLSDLTLK